MKKQNAKKQHKVGGRYYVNGMDEQCLPVRVVVRLVRLLDKCERDDKKIYDCVIASRGVLSYGRLADLSFSK